VSRWAGNGRTNGGLSTGASDLVEQGAWFAEHSGRVYIANIEFTCTVKRVLGMTWWACHSGTNGGLSAGARHLIEQGTWLAQHQPWIDIAFLGAIRVRQGAKVITDVVVVPTHLFTPVKVVVGFFVVQAGTDFILAGAFVVLCTGGGEEEGGQT
jgi:hypothetical protein